MVLGVAKSLALPGESSYPKLIKVPSPSGMRVLRSTFEGEVDTAAADGGIVDAEVGFEVAEEGFEVGVESAAIDEFCVSRDLGLGWGRQSQGDRHHTQG
jgi:hypothetical protein